MTGYEILSAILVILGGIWTVGKTLIHLYFSKKQELEQLQTQIIKAQIDHLKSQIEQSREMHQALRRRIEESELRQDVRIKQFEQKAHQLELSIVQLKEGVNRVDEKLEIFHHDLVTVSQRMKQQTQLTQLGKDSVLVSTRKTDG